MNRLIIITGILVVIFIIAWFIPVKQKDEISIRADIRDVIAVIGIPENWIKWQPEIKKAWRTDSSSCKITKDLSTQSFTISIPRQTFVVKAKGPYKFDVTEEKNGSRFNYSFTILSTKIFTINITSTSNSSLVKVLSPFKKNDSPVKFTINSLNSFVQDVNAFYGYPIEVKPVADSILATSKVFVAKKDFFKVIADNHQLIKQYINDNHLVALNTQMMSPDLHSGDSMNIIFGMPVNKTAPANHGITCMIVPKGKLLTGEYEGAYAKRLALYQAMENYIRDHFLQKAATPFEQYINNKLPESDTSFVKMKLCFPVY